MEVFEEITHTLLMLMCGAMLYWSLEPEPMPPRPREVDIFIGDVEVIRHDGVTLFDSHQQCMAPMLTRTFWNPLPGWQAERCDPTECLAGGDWCK